MITYHSENFENPNIAYIKSVLHNIQEVYIDYAIKAKKAGSNSDIRISEVFLNEKNVNPTKRHVSKGLTITYNVDILISFDP